MIHKLTITRPDDWHIHLRDGDALKTTVPHVANHFARAIIMPNLTPSIKTIESAQLYKARIKSHIPENKIFRPLMTLYLTQETTPQMVKTAKASNIIHGFKLYPAGATTNSFEGVHDIAALYPTFAEMERLDIPLLIHGEVVDPAIDIFDREAVFIERYLIPLANQFPNLRIVLEHISTQDSVDFITSASSFIGATITPQHLLYNRNHILVGGIKPHYYCLPILKRETHRTALLKAVTSGNKKFFIGTDSAPHAQSKKEHACGCAGCYSSTTALSLYTAAFESADALDHLETFLSFNGPDFYKLPRNTETITLIKEPWTVPQSYPYLDQDALIPLGASELLNWRVGEI